MKSIGEVRAELIKLGKELKDWRLIDLAEDLERTRKSKPEAEVPAKTGAAA